MRLKLTVPMTKWNRGGGKVRATIVRDMNTAIGANPEISCRIFPGQFTYYHRRAEPVFLLDLVPSNNEKLEGPTASINPLTDEYCTSAFGPSNNS